MATKYAFRQGLFSLIFFLEFIVHSLITTINISFNKFIYINFKRGYTFGRGLFSLIFGFLDFIFLSIIIIDILSLLQLLLSPSQENTLLNDDIFPLLFISRLHHPFPHYGARFFFYYICLYHLHRKIHFWKRIIFPNF